MTENHTEQSHAREPADLGRLFVARANAGDAAGLAALYEPDAVLVLPGGAIAHGRNEIRAFYDDLLAAHPRFDDGRPRPPVRNGDWALTSTLLPENATTELAHRQPDGTWLWVIDQPDVLGRNGG